MALSNAARAGTALFLGSLQFGVGIILAEIYYPSYNVSSNRISDLGANCGTSPCTINQPASTIFNSSMILLGLAVLIAAFYLQRAFHSGSFSTLMAITALGALGVGLFPETTGMLHDIFSLIVFLFAGLSAVVALGVTKNPFSYFSAVLGLVTLATLVLYVGNMYLGLGPGGMERLVVYPVLLWAVGFGGYLINAQDWPRLP